MRTTLIKRDLAIVIEWEVVNFSIIQFRIPILLDITSIIFLITISIISTRIIFYINSYMNLDPKLNYFTIIVLAFVISINLLILFPNIVFLLLGWDGLGMTSYLLVIYYINDSSLSAGIITIITNRIGDALLIARVAIRFAFNDNIGIFMTFRLFFSITFLIASLTKRAQFPFSAWLPAAIAAPTPVSSLVHSSTLVTAGVYIIIRFYPSVINFYYFNLSILFLGILTCILASLRAYFENDMKKVIALSTLSQLGVIFITIGIGEPNLAFFHLNTHAIFKALLFVAGGRIIHTINTQDLRIIGNCWYSIPFTTSAIVCANIALCGFPFLAGFYSKDSIVETYFFKEVPLLMSFILIVCVGGTATYSLRFSKILLWGTPSINLIRINERYVIVKTYSILLTGAISSGSLLTFMIFPCPSEINIPLIIKTFCLVIVVIFLFLKVNMKLEIPNKIFFLTNLRSSPVKIIHFREKAWTQEKTWIEITRGKGMEQSYINLTRKHLFRYSSLLTIIIMFTIIIIIYLWKESWKRLTVN